MAMDNGTGPRGVAVATNPPRESRIAALIRREAEARDHEQDVVNKIVRLREDLARVLAESRVVPGRKIQVWLPCRLLAEFDVLSAYAADWEIVAETGIKGSVWWDSGGVGSLDVPQPPNMTPVKTADLSVKLLQVAIRYLTEPDPTTVEAAKQQVDDTSAYAAACGASWKNVGKCGRDR